MTIHATIRLAAAITIVAACCASLPAQTPGSQPAAGASGGAAGKSTSKPAAATTLPFRLSHETTRITDKPLRPDGLPDYVALWNAIAGEGVTRDNNAAIKLIEAMGPTFFPEENRQLQLKSLGLELPENGSYYIGFSAFSQKTGELRNFKSEEDAERNPWTSAQYPLLAQWLKANEQVAAKVVEASKRPRFYVPYLLSSPSKPMVAELSLHPCMLTLAKLLLVRANLAIGEGRLDEAWDDILAVYRLGQVVGQDFLTVNRLIAVSLTRLANSAAFRLACQEKLPEQLARRAVRELQTLGPAVDMVQAFDVGERILGLDFLVKLSLDPSVYEVVYDYRAFESFLPDKKASNWHRFVSAVVHHPRIRQRLDWNALLLNENAGDDSIAKAVSMPIYAEQLKAYAQLKKEDTEAVAKVKTIWTDSSMTALSEEQAAKIDTAWVTAALSASVAPLFPESETGGEGLTFRSQKMAQSAAVRRDMAQIAMALAAFKAKEGKLPSRLPELSPTYLKTVPKDFFSGQDFIYKPKADGYILYSVGMNAKDDGGVQAENDEMDIVIECPQPKRKATSE